MIVVAPMHLLFAKHFLAYLLLFTILGVGGLIAFHFYSIDGERASEKATVAIGDVAQIITVSGKIEAKQLSRLGFPVTGTIQHVYKSAGDTVTEGEIIASLTSDALVSEYNAARERVNYFEQVKQQLVKGPTHEERGVAKRNVQIAEIKLKNAQAEYEQAIKNAHQNLLSTDLTAYPTNISNKNTPPVISGNYLCDKEGTYLLSLFPSSAPSGYSYYLSGLEGGTHSANIDTPSPLGECGLYILFATAERYQRDVWIVSIPNRRSPSYVTLKNAYDLLVTQRDAAISSASEALALAKDSEHLLLAPTTEETLSQAESNVAEARARLAQSEARIADYTIRAPFSGIVTNVDMKVGEPASPTHTVTVAFEGLYNLKARIPEIDITKVSIGNPVNVTFDASPDESFSAIVSFISPISSEVGGVAYYDAHITLTTTPTWLREGLNADIKIESQRRASVPVLLKRFMVATPTGNFVLQKNGQTSTRIPVTTGLIGTDGLVEVLNLPVGSEVLLP